MRFGVGSLRAYATSVSGLPSSDWGRSTTRSRGWSRAPRWSSSRAFASPESSTGAPISSRPTRWLVGRRTHAGRCVALDEEVDRTDRLWARAAAERCRGMLDDDFEASLAGRSKSTTGSSCRSSVREPSCGSASDSAGRSARAKRESRCAKPRRVRVVGRGTRGQGKPVPSRGDRRAVWEPRRVGPWRPDAAGAAHRRPRRRGRRPTGKPPQRFSQPEDRGLPPRQGVRQARDQLTRATGDARRPHDTGTHRPAAGSGET